MHFLNVRSVEADELRRNPLTPAASFGLLCVYISLRCKLGENDTEKNLVSFDFTSEHLKNVLYSASDCGTGMSVCLPANFGGFQV